MILLPLTNCDILQLNPPNLWPHPQNCTLSRLQQARTPIHHEARRRNPRPPRTPRPTKLLHPLQPTRRPRKERNTARVLLVRMSCNIIHELKRLLRGDHVHREPTARREFRRLVDGETPRVGREFPFVGDEPRGWGLKAVGTQDTRALKVELPVRALGG